MKRSIAGILLILLLLPFACTVVSAATPSPTASFYVNDSAGVLSGAQEAKMLSAEQVSEFTGHAIGGVCPFGNPEGVRTYLDVSLQRFDTVFPAAGSSNSAIELTCEELAEYSRSLGWIDVCKGWQEEE